MTDPVRLDFAARRKPLIEVVFPEGEFTIDPNLYVDDVADLQALEESISKSKADKDTDGLTQALVDARRAIMFYIRLRHPDAPEIAMTDREILNVMTVMSGNESLTQEVLETLTAGAEDDTPPQAAPGGEGAAADTGGEDADAAPLGSPTRSRRRSSRSASTATSRSRTGGETSRGGSSKP